MGKNFQMCSEQIFLILWVKTSKCVQNRFSLVKVYNSSHTFELDLILVCHLLQYCGIRSVLIKYLQRLVFHFKSV